MPGCSPAAIACGRRVHPAEVGVPSASTNSGTTTTTASLRRTAVGGVGGRLQDRPTPSAPATTSARYSCEVLLAGERRLAAVDRLDQRRVDVGTDHVVPALGELDGQRQADLAEGDDGDVHADLPSMLTRDPRGAGATTVAVPPGVDAGSTRAKGERRERRVGDAVRVGRRHQCGVQLTDRRLLALPGVDAPQLLPVLAAGVGRVGQQPADGVGQIRGTVVLAVEGEHLAEVVLADELGDQLRRRWSRSAARRAGSRTACSAGPVRCWPTRSAAASPPRRRRTGSAAGGPGRPGAQK